jgi:4-alpha-glucanotransferase
MTNQIYLSLVLHHHQPVGQFGYVNEHITHVSYMPMIEALESHQHIRVAMHYSGALLDWLRGNDGGLTLLRRLRALVARGQVEMLSGGYYEPPLAVIPDEDKLGQIEKLNQTVSELFGHQPVGMWLAERLWEPHLARPVHQCGLRYVILDDKHFEAMGINRDRLYGYYITEEAGAPLAVFPSHTNLRYDIPYKPPETLIEEFHAQAEKSPKKLPFPRVMMMAEDGGKFGMWPGTYERCWGDGKYIEELFNSLYANRDWLRTITPGQYMGRFSSLGQIYLPATSYQEMGRWSLPPQDTRRLDEIRRHLEKDRRLDRQDIDLQRFFSVGQWRNFLVRYEEINHMHKRMLLVSEKVRNMRRGRKRDRALERLWAAQCNDAYWHGLFGGAYLFNLRTTNYANLLAAEEAAEAEDMTIQLSRKDFYCSGSEDIIVTGQTLGGIWSLAKGGALVELDFRPSHYNLCNVFTRREEAYHETLRNLGEAIPTPESPEYLSPDAHRAKEPNLHKMLIYDWHRRASFLDHFLHPSTTLEEFYHAQYAEDGNFVDQKYEVQDAICDSVSAHIALARDGNIWMDGIHCPLRVEKAFTLQFNSPIMYVKYRLSHPGPQTLYVRFGIETVIGFDGGQDIRNCTLQIDQQERLPLNKIASFTSVNTYSIESNLANLTTQISLNKAATLWQFPLETITLSEAGFERGYQGTVMLQWWDVQLAPGMAWELAITQSVQQISSRIYGVTNDF